MTFAVAGISGCRSSQPAPVQTVPANSPAQGQQGTLNPDGSFTPAQPGTQTVTPADRARAEERHETPAERARENGAVVATAPRQAAPGYSQNNGNGPNYGNGNNNRPVNNAGYGQGNNGPAYSQARPEIPSGTSVAVRITETLSASHNNVGDSFSGVLEQPLSSGNYNAFPRGTRVAGTVIAAKGRGRFKGAGDLGIELTSIGGARVTTSEYERTAPGKGTRTAETVGGGAGLGAIIGGIVGGGKGAAIGAAAGAGAGAIGGAYTGNNDVVIPSESVVTFTLTSPVVTR